MEARACCRKEEDYVSMDLFEELLADEEGHINYLETQLNLLSEIGAQNYGQLNAHSADDMPEDKPGVVSVPSRHSGSQGSKRSAGRSGFRIAGSQA
jgi:hypothetical protein